MSRLRFTLPPSPEGLAVRIGELTPTINGRQRPPIGTSPGQEFQDVLHDDAGEGPPEKVESFFQFLSVDDKRTEPVTDLKYEIIEPPAAAQRETVAATSGEGAPASAAETAGTAAGEATSAGGDRAA